MHVLLLLRSLIFIYFFALVSSSSYCGTNHYGNDNTLGLYNTSWNSSQISFSRVWVPSKIDASCIAEYFGSPINSSFCTVSYALYSDNPQPTGSQPLPGNVISNTTILANISLGANGTLNFSFPNVVSLPIGWYWIAAIFNSSDPLVPCTGATSLSMQEGFDFFSTTNFSLAANNSNFPPSSFGNLFVSHSHLKITRYLVSNTTAALQGGLKITSVGASTFIDFTNFTAYTWMPSTSFSIKNSTGLGFSDPAAGQSPGKLDSTIWRVTGLRGNASSSCPSNLNNWTTGCSTTFGAIGGYTVGAGAGPDGYGNYTLASLTSSFISSSLTAGGGIFSFHDSGFSSLGFLPFWRSSPINGSSSSNDLAPGAIILRLVNNMGYRIESLAVRFSLQCANVFSTSTTVAMQYAYTDAIDDSIALYNTSLEFTTPSACGSDCGCTSDSCWALDYYLRKELTGLAWETNQPFYLHFNISTSASTTTAPYGDPCKIMDIELIPFVQQTGDTSLEIRQSGYNTGNVTDSLLYPFGMNFSSNFTSSLYVMPSSWQDGLDSNPRIITDDDMVLFAGWDSTRLTEIAWVLIPSSSAFIKWAVALRFTSKTDGTTQYLVSFSSCVTPDDWNYISFTYAASKDGSLMHNITLYIGDQLIGSKSFNSTLLGGTYSFGATSNSSLGDFFTIGHGANQYPSQNTSSNLIGFLDEFRLWSGIKNATYLSYLIDKPVPNLSDTTLLLYFQFNSFNATTFRLPNSKLNSTYSLYFGNANATFSNVSALSLAPIIGGSINCATRWISANGGTTSCNFTSVTMSGDSKASFDSSIFSVKISNGGLGTVGSLLSDSTGLVWNFVFSAGASSGDVVLQAYSHGVAFASGGYTIFVMPEACTGCKFREKRSGRQFFDCSVGGRLFVVADITTTSGTCPLY